MRVQVFEIWSSVTELFPFEGSARRIGLDVPPEDGPSSVPVAAGDFVAVVVDCGEIREGCSGLQHLRATLADRVPGRSGHQDGSVGLVALVFLLAAPPFVGSLLQHRDAAHTGDEEVDEDR